MKQWQESNLSFDEYFTPDCEVSEAVFDYFLNVLPPIYIPKGFQVSEPVTCDNQGRMLYNTFINHNGKYIHVGLRRFAQS